MNVNIYKLAEETIRYKIEHEEADLEEAVADYIDSMLDLHAVVVKMLDSIDLEEMALDILNE